MSTSSDVPGHRDPESSRDRFPYPGGTVVGVLLDDTALSDARERLAQADFEPDSYEVLQGEAGVGRIDVEGKAHGLAGTIKRWLQDALSDDADQARRYAEHLREGHVVLGVSVGEDQAAKERAARALREARAEFINYYADNYVEDLDAGR